MATAIHKYLLVNDETHLKILDRWEKAEVRRVRMAAA
jgi:hypothetical protein